MLRSLILFFYSENSTMALSLTSRFSVRRAVPTCRTSPIVARKYHASVVTRAGGLQSTPVRVGDPDEDKSPSVDASKQPLPEDLRELNARFNDLFSM